MNPQIILLIGCLFLRSSKADRGIEYNSCTIASNNGVHWCATSLFENSTDVRDFDSCRPDCFECRTQEGNVCQFPLRIDNEEFNSCIDFTNTGLYFCQTEEETDLDFITVEVCVGDCVPKDIVEAGECGTVGGLRCLFPFTYRDKVYNSCTTVENSNIPWCAVSFYPGTNIVEFYDACNCFCSDFFF